MIRKEWGVGGGEVVVEGKQLFLYKDLRVQGNNSCTVLR